MKKTFIVLLLVSGLLQAFIVNAQTAVRIMSYNMLYDSFTDSITDWQQRKQQVLDLLRYHEPDVLGTQELLHHQLKYITDSLKQYNTIGVARNDGRQEGEYAAILYKKSNYTCTDSGTFWLSFTPGQPSKGWDASYFRICTYAKLTDKQTKQSFYVFNTHFEYRGKQAKIESARLCLDKIQTINKKGLPVFFIGDFNSDNQDTVTQIIKTRFDNARDKSAFVYGQADNWNSHHISIAPKGWVDHIFVSKGPKVKVKKFATLTDSYKMYYPSDHLPVIADIFIEK